MTKERPSHGPRWVIAGTAFLGLVAALFVSVAKYYDIGKARADAERSWTDAERAKTGSQLPPAAPPAKDVPPERPNSTPDGVRNPGPPDSATLVKRGTSYLEKGQYDQALAEFSAALRIDADNPHAYQGRGRSYYQKGDFNKAISDFTELVRVDPKSAEGFTERGRAYSRKNVEGKAIADCSEAIRLDPTYAKAYYFRSLAHSHRGDKDKAREDRKRAVELGWKEEKRRDGN